MAFRDQLTVPVGSENTPGMSRSLSLSILAPNGFNKRPFVGKIKGMYVPGNIQVSCVILEKEWEARGKKAEWLVERGNVEIFPPLYGAVK